MTTNSAFSLFALVTSKSCKVNCSREEKMKINEHFEREESRFYCFIDGSIDCVVD